MRQNNILTHFLRLGSILAVCVVFVSCNTKKIDYIARADWAFKNESSYKIEVKAKVFNSFILQPGEGFKFHDSGNGPKNMTPEDYHTPYSGSGGTIIIDDIHEHTLSKDESITGIRNYIATKIANNYYHFEYIFTDKDYEDALAAQD